MTIPESRRLEFSEVPVIDLEPVLSGGGHAPTVEAVAAACTDVGFLYIRNHGIEPGLIDALHEQAGLFFAQPMEEKNKIVIDRRIRGYLPLRYRSYEGEARAGTSHQEGFWIGHERQLNSQRPLDGPNQWPQDPSSLKTVMLSYFDAVEALSVVLHCLFAEALGLEADFFLPMYNNPTSRLKLNHYPPQLNPENENDIGVVPHTDSGGFTILWQDDNGGLEVQAKNGDWVGAPPMEGALVVNLGNIMQYWSNGRFSSTPHRVINRHGRDRISIPLFVNPNPEVCIRSLVDRTGGGFEPFVYGDYQLDLWRRTFPIADIP